MDLETIEGYVEVEGRIPVVVTAVHGFGTDSFKHLIKALKKCRCKAYQQEVQRLLLYYSAVDFYTWEVAYKAAVATGAWALLPTLSKVDYDPALGVPDYNLNKHYAKGTPFWKRLGELISERGVRAVIDIHGMKFSKRWPHICISTRGFTTASKKLVAAVSAYLRKHGLTVAVDYPFSGGALIAEFGRPPEVEAFALEIRRDLRFAGSKIPALIAGVIEEVSRLLL